MASPPPPSRRSDNAPQRKPKRSRREPDDEFLATCLVALARSAADPSPTATVSVEKRTKLSPPSGGDQSPFAANPSPSSAASVQKQIKLSHAPLPRVNSYRCSICEKGFASHQALCGHKASHRSKPPTAPEEPSPSSSNPSGPHRHKCSQCSKSFTTGQALGGHMRKHYLRKNGGANSSTDGSSVITSSSDRGNSNDGGDATRIHRNFDLNLPPSPEESEPDLTLKL